MKERPTQMSVRLAAAAACAFTLAALVEIIPPMIGRPQHTAGISGFGFAAVALLWWAVFFTWKRKLA